MTYNAVADGIFTFAQFMIPALAIAQGCSVLLT
jgi:hypothetical protein